MSAPPVAMTIAGSDGSGGAGIAADLKTFAALGVYGVYALTAVTAQNTRRVLQVEAVSVEMVRAQIEAVREDFEVAAVKTGMLMGSAVAAEVASLLNTLSPRWLVVDPVAIAGSDGSALFVGDARRTLIEHFFPLRPVLTPNLPEAEVLLGESIGAATEERIDAARRIAGMGPQAVLLKGGHMEGKWAEDVLVTERQSWIFTAERLAGGGGHGTGCTLAAALTALLARGRSLPAAAVQAKEYLSAALREAPELGAGPSPLNHFHAFHPREEEKGLEGEGME